MERMLALTLTIRCHGCITGGSPMDGDENDLGVEISNFLSGVKYLY